MLIRESAALQWNLSALNAGHTHTRTHTSPGLGIDTGTHYSNITTATATAIKAEHTKQQPLKAGNAFCSHAGCRRYCCCCCRCCCWECQQRLLFFRAERTKRWYWLGKACGQILTPSPAPPHTDKTKFTVGCGPCEQFGANKQKF